MNSQQLRAIEISLALTVGVVLADSSIVTLALPSILREYDATVFGVSWVLTAFNLVLALLILPAVRVARSHPRGGWTVGMAVFVIASIGCAASGGVAALIGARVAQAAGGALAVACAIELLARLRGSHRLAAPAWGAAGTIGIAVGPAIGGLLTQLLEWQAIFLLQIPLLLLIPVATAIRPAVPEPGPAGVLDLRPEVALGPPLGGPDRGAVSARRPAHRGLGAVADRRRGDGLGDSGSPRCSSAGSPPGPGRRPRRRWPAASPWPAAWRRSACCPGSPGR